jgi:hypothetical protein
MYDSKVHAGHFAQEKIVHIVSKIDQLMRLPSRRRNRKESCSCQFQTGIVGDGDL